MKRSIIVILAVIALPFMASAQDDLYFTPSKAQLKAEKEKRAAARAAREAAQLERDSQPAEYYSGINKTDDEYNRRIKTTGNNIYTVNEKDIHSTDSIASDIIEFTAEKGVYPSDHNVADTVYKYIFVNDEDDYRYSRYMSRWDDFFWWHRGFGPWGGYYPLSWYAGWYGPWGPWYDPWYGPWYDPWFDPWFVPWFYDPWFHHHYYGWYRPWGGWYGPVYYIGGGGGHHGNYYASRHGGAPTGTANHAGAIRNHNFLADNSRGGSSRISNNDIARRNGDVVSHYGHARASGLRFGGDRNNRNSYSEQTASSRFSGNRSNYPSNSSYSGSRSGGFSGGGGGGFSGGHSGGGGHFGGGGGGGARFSGGRR